MATSRKDDITTIGLIGLAHGTSHFHHLLLPPLFPAFIQDFGLSYSQLGLLVTVFFAISGVGQALAGFVVDRFGARPVLFAAMCSFIASSLVAASAQSYAGLALAAALAGLGNAPFHPADFTILNRRITPERLGHAFAAHALSGNLGWALAPIFLTGLSGLLGGWRAAALCSAALGAVVLGVLIARRAWLDDHHAQVRARLLAERKAASMDASAAKPEHAYAFLKLPAVWLSFSFFFWITAALSAVQSFAAPALFEAYGLPQTVGAGVVTAYMLLGAAGIVVGGFLAPKARRLEQVIAAAMGFSLLMLLLTASGWLHPWMAATAVALAGVGTGIAGPSRDMLVRRAAPEGATGRVYGTVYSGLDLGFVLAAPVMGALLDRGFAHGVFLASAGALLLGIVSASAVGRQLRPPGH